MEEAEELCDRVGIFVDGNFQCLGTPKEVIKFKHLKNSVKENKCRINSSESLSFFLPAIQ